MQFCCGQRIVHHKGAAWKQLSCFSQLRNYRYCTSISFGLLLLLAKSIVETLCGLLELGLSPLAELLRSFLDKLSRKIEGDSVRRVTWSTIKSSSIIDLRYCFALL